MKLLTKQEEIREGIMNLVPCPDNPNNCDEDLACDDCPIKNSYIDELLNWLNHKGVVIKVDRELPQNPIVEVEYKGKRVGSQERFGYFRGQESMVQAGYVATEPLLEVNSNEITY